MHNPIVYNLPEEMNWLFYYPGRTDADLAQQVEQLTCNHQVISSVPVVGTICGYRIMAITSVFQADDVGSIPAAAPTVDDTKLC